MKILLINNDGGGFADYVEVDPDTTVLQLFNRHMKFAQPEHFLIRVNRLPCTADQALQEGDRVSITPTRIEGARRNRRSCGRARRNLNAFALACPGRHA
jgi:hypothetical protein